MGFLTNLFKTKELMYLEQLYKETKEDKEQLKTDNEQLRQQITSLNTQLMELLTKQSNNINNINNPYETPQEIKDIDLTPQKLAPKEKHILKLIEQYKTYNQVLQHSNMKESSFKVYISRIKNKGYPIEFQE